MLKVPVGAFIDFPGARRSGFTDSNLNAPSLSSVHRKRSLSGFAGGREIHEKVTVVLARSLGRSWISRRRDNDFADAFSMRC